MKKGKRFEIRLSDIDYKIIEKKAEMLDITMTEFIRQAAVNKQVKGFEQSELNLSEEQCKGQLSFVI